MIAIPTAAIDKHPITAVGLPRRHTLKIEKEDKDMKKVLLATTVLAMSATVAAAEVTVGGDGRIGIVQGFKTTADEKQKISFSSRIRIEFNGAGETDAGLAFGGSVRAQDAVGGATGTKGSVFIAGEFGTLSMGDVDSAALAAVGQISGVGYTGLGDKNEFSYGGIPFKPAALYEYAIGDATIYASLSQPSARASVLAANGTVGTVVTPGNTHDVFGYSVGASYTFGDYRIAGGYENVENKEVTTGQKIVQTVFAIGGDATFAGAFLQARYISGELKPATGSKSTGNTFSVSGDYAIDNVTLTGFVESTETKVADVKTEQTVFGIGAAYDLGGGAAIAGGFVQDKIKNGLDSNAFDLGVTFSF